jgi:hypothetical protein
VFFNVFHEGKTMHRMKIGLIAAALLLIFTALFYFSVTNTLVASATRDVDERVARGQRIHQQISRLGGLDLANLAMEKSRRPAVLAAVSRTEETARRQASYEECDAINAALSTEGRKADIVLVLDAHGKVVARDLNPNSDENGDDYKSKYPAADAALKGHAVKDVWTLKGRMTEVGLAPILRSDGTPAGALLVGYVLSAKQALSKEAPTEVHHYQIENQDYAVVAAPLPANYADRTSGVLLLSSVSSATDRAKAGGTPVLMLGLLAILVAVVASVMTAKRFMKPLDSIELGVNEVMNGNIDYTFKPVGPDFEGLSNSLNVMLARLLGRDEPNEDAVEEEETEVEKWKAESMVIDEGDGAPSPGGQALGQESEASYYPRLYNEYLAALRAGGKTSEGVSVQQFMAKLRLAEAGLKQKWTCKMVRFQMVQQGDQIVFRAMRID